MACSALNISFLRASLQNVLFCNMKRVLLNGKTWLLAMQNGIFHKSNRVMRMDEMGRCTTYFAPIPGHKSVVDCTCRSLIVVADI